MRLLYLPFTLACGLLAYWLASHVLTPVWAACSAAWLSSVLGFTCIIRSSWNDPPLQPAVQDSGADAGEPDVFAVEPDDDRPGLPR